MRRTEIFANTRPVYKETRAIAESVPTNVENSLLKCRRPTTSGFSFTGLAPPSLSHPIYYNNANFENFITPDIFRVRFRRPITLSPPPHRRVLRLFLSIRVLRTGHSGIVTIGLGVWNIISLKRKNVTRFTGYLAICTYHRTFETNGARAQIDGTTLRR